MSFPILSLDGGGMRGLVTALMLQELEAKIQQHSPGTQLKNCFRLIAGTSTGSLIACALSRGISIGKIVEFYSLESEMPQQIFPPRSYIIAGIINRFHLGISQPIYDGKGLEAVLQNIFQTAKFYDLGIQTLVTSYDVFNRQAIVFNSVQSECKTLPIWEVCRASAAAPVAFPGYILKDNNFLNYWRKKGFELARSPFDNQNCIPLVDGGLVANNPTLCAIAEAIKAEHNPSNLLVASFGSGADKNKSIGVKQAREWGAVEWINPLNNMPLFGSMADGSSDATDHVAQRVVPSEQYYRFQPLFENKHSTFDATPKNIETIQKDTEKYIKIPAIQDQLNRLAVQLVSIVLRAGQEAKGKRQKAGESSL